LVILASETYVGRAQAAASQWMEARDTARLGREAVVVAAAQTQGSALPPRAASEEVAS